VKKTIGVGELIPDCRGSSTLKEHVIVRFHIIQTEMTSSRTVPTFLLENFPGEVPIGEEKPGEKNRFKRAEGFPEIVGEKGGER